jgi:hypothetical protein
VKRAEEAVVGRLIAGVLVTFALLAPAAQAAPPPNDDRADAQPVGSLPASIRGTTVEATPEAGEPFSCAGTPGASVWYQLSAASRPRSIVLDLAAAGDLDAVIDVFRRDRSQLAAVRCEQTGRRGQATMEFTATRGATYLIRVAPRPNSAQDAFTLRVVEPDAPEPPPGRALPAAGANGSVDRIANPDDAYRVSLSAGVSYRVHVVSRGPCVIAALYGRGTRSFEAAPPLRGLRCDDYLLYTPGPGQGGRHTLRVLAPPDTRGGRAYHLHVAPAGADDTAPGIEIGNDVRVRGSLRGGSIDVVDLYRFDVRQPSTLDLGLQTAAGNPFNLVLVGAGGGRIACACGDAGPQQIALRLKPGRYFAAVRSRGGANGAYVLSRLSRIITQTRVRIDGRRRAEVSPGSTVQIGVRVTRGASGPVTLDVERFDPLAGWQFHARFRPEASRGRADVAFTPPSEGRWRVRASFDGTRTAAPSGPDEAQLLVAEPLRPAAG